MRSFIALEFPEEIKDAVDRSTLILRKSSESGVFSRRENYHITLAFLGEIDDGSLSAVSEIMERFPLPRSGIRIGRLGEFRSKSGATVWRSIEMPAKLFDLQSGLCASLIKAGFKLENREFRPHLTLARQVILKPGISLSALSEHMRDIRCQAEKMTLMRSDRIKGRLVYTPVYTVKSL